MYCLIDLFFQLLKRLIDISQSLDQMRTESITGWATLKT
jgi:hypothetical protein